MSKDAKNVPALRFKGYSDAWEKRKVSDYLCESRIPGSNGLKAKKLTVKLWGKGVVPKNETYSGSIKTKYYVRSANQLIYGKLDFLHAAFGIVPQSLDGWESTIDSPAFDVNTSIGNAAFLLALFLRPNFYLREGIRANGSRKAKRIHEDTFLSMSISAPQRKEQDQIAVVLDKTELLIAATQDKIDALEQAKKALLQRLFDQSWRFKGYSDPWEKRKLGELAEFINGRAYKQDELLTSGKYPVLRVGNFYTNDKWYYSDLELPEKYYAEKGDLLYTWSATFGPHIWIGPKVIYHYHIWKVALKNLFEKDFALQFFEADRVRLLNSTNGSTMIHVTKKDMESKGILLPDVYEQRTIGELLKRVDDLIAATQSRLSSLELLKKALLQDLFI